ncbi:hypothetical protein BT63DRAFT_370335 [Microthyrium microscopicum]|uniref:Pre-mRNA-splicing factor n=1 Tax=Microthyrium microscopicum TaxID=703497 RepID=A0A6A6UID9_9PEZI|nr:hypothetical protein BT63DRAFT_370335 [Microthyrium microscopicum]
MASGFAPKKVSLAFGKKPALKPSNGIKRSAAVALHDSDDEDATSGKHVEISAFDHTAGGAVHANDGLNKKAGPLVIPAQPNSDILEYGRRKKQRSDIPQENGNDIVIKKKEVTYGLSVPTKKPEVDGDGEAMEGVEANDKEAEPSTRKERTEDEIALDAIMGNQGTSNMMIPIADEDEALRRDMEGAQDVPTLDQYLAVPPSEFGAAALRGMGWKDTETIGKGTFALKPKVVERRPALLGVGAKPSSAVGIELGEWGKSARHKGPKKVEAYNPVVLKNKKTGEVLTEEELKARLDDQGKTSTELVFDDNEGSRSEKKSRRDDYRNSDRDFDKKRDKYDSDHKRSSRKDRDDGRDRRKRNYSDDSDDGHRRRRKDDDHRRSEKKRQRSRSPTTERDTKYRSRKDEDRRDREDRKYRKDKYHDDKREKYREDKYEKPSRRDRDDGRYEKDPSRRR